MVFKLYASESPNSHGFPGLLMFSGRPYRFPKHPSFATTDQ